jgi:hypothetical protein
VVPSSRIAAVITASSPLNESGCIAPDVPTRMKVSAPILISSSTAMAADGQPIPVETTLTRSPSSVPVQVSYSRLRATRTGSSNRAAIGSHRPGSPGSSTYRPTSPRSSVRCSARCSAKLTRRPPGPAR